jgi:ankyrin repeat protein
MNHIFPDSIRTVSSRRTSDDICNSTEAHKTKKRRVDIRSVTVAANGDVVIDFTEDGKIEEISNQTEALLPSAAKASPTPPKPFTVQKWDLHALFLCDIACRDGNGAGLQTARDALKMRIPFFCSKAMISGAFIQCGSSDFRKIAALKAASMEIFQEINHCPPTWEIWEETGDRELLFFVPKEACGGAAEKEKLAAFGINENRLKRIENYKALEGHLSPLTLDAFLSIFNCDLESKVRLALTAHSGPEHAGGMTKGDFVRFLKFFNEKRRCSGLFVTTCFAGGVNTACYRGLNLHYPVVIRSIGDFPAYYTEAKSASLFFSCSENLLLQPVDKTAKVYQDSAWENEGFPWQNLPQIKSPGGHKFVPLAANRRVGQTSKDETNTQLFWASKIILLTSRYITKTLNINSINPLLLSMKPLHTTHVIERLIHSGKLESLLQTTIDAFRNKPKGTSRQLLFIKEMRTQNASYKNMLFSCGPEEAILLGYDPNKQVYFEYRFSKSFEIGKTPLTPISKDYYSLLTYQVAKHHLENSYKKPVDVLDTIVNALEECEGGLSPLLKLALAPPRQMAEAMPANADHMETLLLLSAALAQGKNSLFNEMLETAKPYLNQTVVHGRALLHLSVQALNPLAVGALLKTGADVNKKEAREQQTALHLIVRAAPSKERNAIFQQILQADGLNIEAKDSQGKTPLYYASNLEDAEKLIRAGALLDLPHESNPIKAAIHARNYPLVDYYLGKVFFGNTADGAAYLADAIAIGSKEIAALLLKNGADPTAINPQGTTAFCYCALFGTPHMMETLYLHAYENMSGETLRECLLTAGNIAIARGYSAMLWKCSELCQDLPVR